MSEYPDPDEEFELMYGDELELLNEHENDIYEPSQINKKTQDCGTPTTSSTSSYENISNKNSIDAGYSLPQEKECSASGSQMDLDLATTEQSNNRKRTADELFGDISDLEDDLMFVDHPNVKKQKSNEYNEKLALIEHILELRKLSKEKHSITSLKNNYTTSSLTRDKYNLSYRVPKYPFITVTRSDSEKIYVRFHSEEFEKEDTERAIQDCSFREVLGESFKEVWNKARDIINIKMDLLETLPSNELSVINVDENKLWVDLYKPRKYLELLSDESTNRIMLRWMKLWDKVVFNRNPKIKPIKHDEHNNKPYFKKQELNTNLDEYGRPEHKVALLCGPPGLGKTTLAHMVAIHAGYNVIEINASDDRTTESFKTCLENATQMRSLVDQEKRPNCIIFDEIDGAPQASIDYLVKFINGTTPKTKKDKSEKRTVLKRPIICICNDVYVPALRPLRQIAFVVNFPPVSSARLAERLMEIARKQAVKTDIGAMLALAEKSNNDIRSCLSVLHFYKAQNKAVTLSEIHKSNVGQKDMQRGLFSVWQEIFKIEQSKSVSSRKDGLKNRMKNVLEVVSLFGDYERVAQGVFENYPLLKLKDSSFDAISTCLEWFVFSDILNKQIYQQQNYTLTPYLQYAFVVWHFVFATTNSQKLTYPTASYEAKMKESRQKALISEVLRGVQVSVRPYCQRMSLILDILPFLVRIIVPSFRPVSLHLYTKEEKDNMLNVVHIMIDYNLTYIQQKAIDGTYSYTLEPNVRDVVIFDPTERSRRRMLSYSNMQLIAREIELEKMRKFEAPKTTERSQVPSGTTGDAKDKIKDVTQLPNHLQKLKAKTVKTTKPVLTKDFFGRVITKSLSCTGKNTSKPENDIWYQYKEGYNNAVRKKILISSLK